MKTRIFTVSLAVIAGMALLGQLSMTAAEENPAAPAVSTSPVQLLPNAAEVLKLVRAKIGEETIVAFVRNSKTAYNLSANEIVYLREQGVPDRIITAMVDQHQQPAATWTAPAVPPPQQQVVSAPPASPPQTTIVQPAPAYVAPPAYVYSPPVYYDYPYYGAYWGFPALSFSFGFGHGHGHWGGYHGGYHGHH